MLTLQEPLRCNTAADASAYPTRLADFQAAYQNMRSCSQSFNAILAGVPAELTDQERRWLIGGAASVYENAREEFLTASAKLHELLIGEIISFRPTIRAAATN